MEFVGMKSKIFRCFKLSMEKWKKTPVKNRQVSNAVAAYSDMKRNIPEGLSITIIILYNT